MAIKPKTNTPSFETELIRLHVEKIFADLGPKPRGIHLLIVPHGASTAHWYRAVENQICDIKLKLGEEEKAKDFVNELVIPDDWTSLEAGEVQSDYDVGVDLLGGVGLDDRTHGEACVILIAGNSPETLDHPSLLLVDSTIKVKFDPYLAVEAAATCGRVINLKEAFILTRMAYRRRAIAFRSSRSIRESWVLHCKARQIEARKQKEKEEEEERENAKKRPKAKDERIVPDDTPYLQEMHGFGPAADWGRELAQDVEDWRRGHIGWSDVDNAVLLSGSPGCGKTTFAAALAKTFSMRTLSSAATAHGWAPGMVIRAISSAPCDELSTKPASTRRASSSSMRSITSCSVEASETSAPMNGCAVSRTRFWSVWTAL